VSLEQYWPMFGLQITTPQLTLRVPGDDELAEVMDLVQRGVHDPAWMPFTTPWTDLESPELERSALQYWWRSRALFSPVGWDLLFVVAHQGIIIGTQNLTSTDFPTVRVAETGSWLGLDYQGQGFGKEMRRAVLHLAFEYLGAQAIVSTAFADNASSQGVSLAVGYEENGRAFARRRDERDELIRYRITRDRWHETRTDMPITVTGFAACAEMFGLT